MFCNTLLRSFVLPVGTCQPVHLHGSDSRYGPLAAMSLTLPVFFPSLWRSLSFALSNQETSSMTCHDFYKIITFEFTHSFVLIWSSFKVLTMVLYCDYSSSYFSVLSERQRLLRSSRYSPSSCLFFSVLHRPTQCSQ